MNNFWAIGCGEDQRCYGESDTRGILLLRLALTDKKGFQKYTDDKKAR